MGQNQSGEARRGDTLTLRAIAVLVTPIVMVAAYKTKWGLKPYGTDTNETAALLHRHSGDVT